MAPLFFCLNVKLNLGESFIFAWISETSNAFCLFSFDMKTPEIIDHRVPAEFSSALSAKCPRCRRGNMFSNSMYGLKLQKMNDTCPHCGLKFEREPGYFYVSMFISYGMNVLQMLAAAMLTYFITGNLKDPLLYIMVIFPVILILSPFNYRFSRIILLYWLTPGLHYVPETSKDH